MMWFLGAFVFAYLGSVMLDDWLKTREHEREMKRLGGR